MISGMLNGVESDGLGYAISGDRAPTSEQRAFLDRRLADLDGALRPATEAEIFEEVGVLTVAMAAPDGSPNEQRAVLRVYAAVLAGITQRGLKQACRAFLTGARGDGRWMPKAGELRQAAVEFVRPLEDELGKIHKIVNAKVLPVVDSRRQAAVLELAAKTAADLRKSADPHVTREPYRLPTMQEAEANLERIKAEGKTFKLSAEALATCGVRPPPESDRAA